MFYDDVKKDKNFEKFQQEISNVERKEMKNNAVQINLRHNLNAKWLLLDSLIKLFVNKKDIYLFMYNITK